MKAKQSAEQDDMEPEYDFTGGVRGKYFEKYGRLTYLIKLDDDVVEVFHDEKQVNDILRALIPVVKRH